MFCVIQQGNDLEHVSCERPDALLVMSRSEFTQMSPFYLDMQSAVMISGALLFAACAAYVLRAIRNFILDDED